MQFRKDSYYLTSVILCFTLAIFIKLHRKTDVVHHEFVQVLLGSLPSFLYLYGLVCLVPLFKKDLTVAGFVKSALFLTLGALSYELEQLYSSRVFDYFDIAATILALLIVLFVHKIHPRMLRLIWQKSKEPV